MIGKKKLDPEVEALQSRSDHAEKDRDKFYSTIDFETPTAAQNKTGDSLQHVQDFANKIRLILQSEYDSFETELKKVSGSLLLSRG